MFAAKNGTSLYFFVILIFPPTSFNAGKPLIIAPLAKFTPQFGQHHL
jgi:hypothetical protein